MSSMKFGPSTAVFIIFFGLALYEAVSAGNWIFATVFLVLAFLSLRADALNRRS